MNLIAEKLELAKRLLDVEDEGLLFQLKQVLDPHDEVMADMQKHL